MVVPSGPQPIGAAATVRPIPETAAIESDLVLAPTEEIVEVVNAAPVDELLDDRPVFLPELQAAARPEGVETIIETVEGADSIATSGVVEIPSAATVEILDADSNTSLKRITVNQTADGWNWPARGLITREFDLREINRQGLDIDPGPGAAIQAAADGEVVYSGKDLASYGNLVILRHDNNFLTAYSKVNEIFVQENQKVKAGELIAAVGDQQTGSSELHFEIRRNGEPVNPIDYLPTL